MESFNINHINKLKRLVGTGSLDEENLHQYIKQAFPSHENSSKDVLERLVNELIEKGIIFKTITTSRITRFYMCKAQKSPYAHP